MREQKGDGLLDATVLRRRDRGGMDQEAQERRALAAILTRQQRQVVVAGEGRVRLALGQDRVRVGQQQSLDGGKRGRPARAPWSWQASTVSRSRATRASVSAACRARYSSNASLARLCMRVVRRTNISAASSSARATWLRSSAAISARRLLSTMRPEVGGAERARLGRELAQLAVRHAGERCRYSPRPARRRPGEVGKVLAHTLRAGSRRVRLDQVPAGSGCARRHHEQSGQALARFGRQAAAIRRW